MRARRVRAGGAGQAAVLKEAEGGWRKKPGAGQKLPLTDRLPSISLAQFPWKMRGKGKKDKSAWVCVASEWDSARAPAAP